MILIILGIILPRYNNNLAIFTEEAAALFGNE